MYVSSWGKLHFKLLQQTEIYVRSRFIQILYTLIRLIILTYLLTPQCRVLLEKLTGLQLVKKFPAFHGTRRFITALTSVCHPVHIPTSHLLEIHPNIIHPSTPRSPQWSPSLRFPHQDPIHSPLLTHTRQMEIYLLHNERVGMEKIRNKNKCSKKMSRKEHFGEDVRC